MAKSYNSIVKEMAQGPSKPLFIEMEVYCRKADLDIMETFFGEDIAPKTVKLWMNDADFLEWMADRLNPDEPTDNGQRRWFYKEQPRDELVRQSVEVVEGNFISWRDSSGGSQGSYQDFRIRNHHDKVVQPMIAGEDRYRDIARALAPVIEEDGYQISTNEAKIIWDYASVHGRLLNAKPVLCAQADEDRWCLHRINVVPDIDGDFPTIQQFLDRVNDPIAFSAWLYGVYSGQYVGRQVLWLRGKGSDGKSTLMKAYSTLFGVAAGAVDWNQLKANPGFAGSLFVNKRFVYVPDNNNPELLNTGLFKSLSDPGSDPVVINHKYGKMYATELEAHTAVLSNFEPSIRGETHSLSRCLYLTVEPRDLSVPADKNITDKFIAELPGYLAFARECYAMVCRNNTEIDVNEDAQAAIGNRVASTSERWESLIEQYFVIEDGATVEGNEVYKMLTTDARLSNNKVSDFRSYLDNTYGVRWGQFGSQRKRQYKGMRLKTSADRKSGYGTPANDLVSSEVA